MKKTLFVVCMLLISLACIFAEWQVGFYIDDFGDRTGEEFVYTIVDGTFSNTASKNALAPTRIIASINSAPIPNVTFTFEPHDYSFDNPVNKFYSSTKSVIKVKDQNNEVHTYNSGKGEYFSRPWNELPNAEFTRLMLDNELLKVVIKAESSTYRFDVPVDNFKDIIIELYENNKKPLDVWTKNYYPQDMLDFYAEMIELYADLGIEKYFGDYSWEMYTKGTCAKGDYLLSFDLLPEDYRFNDYPVFSVYFYDYEKYNTMFVESSLPDVNVSKIIFSNADSKFELQDTDPKDDYNDFEFTKSSYAEFQKLCRQGDVNVIIKTTNLGDITCMIDGLGIVDVCDSLDLEEGWF